MTDAELQRASDDHGPGAWPEALNAAGPSILADGAEEAGVAQEAELAPEHPTEPLAGAPPGVVKGIVYW